MTKPAKRASLSNTDKSVQEPTSSPQTGSPSTQEPALVARLWTSYSKTHRSLQIIDAYMLFLMLSGVSQMAYRTHNKGTLGVMQVSVAGGHIPLQHISRVNVHQCRQLCAGCQSAHAD